MTLLGTNKHIIEYHGRPGYPQVHRSKSGRKYMMVRAPGGGRKRLYAGSRYWSHKDDTGRRVWRTLRLEV